MPNAAYDLVLFGATGFTGRLTAEYLAEYAPDELRWAIAGRNEAKLNAVKSALVARDSRHSALQLLTVDSTNAAQLSQLAASANVIATTVGPYLQFGEPLVAACAAAGTDYLDLTGEPEFVDTMYVRHAATAQRTGARLVHACGFDSVPFDVGAYYTVLQLPVDVPITIRSYLEVSGRASGGTTASALTALSRPRAHQAAARMRSRLEPRTGTRSVHSGPGRPHRSRTPHGWALPMPTIDPQIVARSARSIERYGPDFRYAQHICLPTARSALGVSAGAAGLVALAQLPPARRAVLNRIPPGTGPSEARRAKNWFRVTFLGEAGGRRVVTRVSGGDPGYDETARIFTESALALALDELPDAAGQLTPVTAMRDALLGRLQRSGLRFEVLESN